MNIITLAHTLRDAIHDDSATQTWCTDNYGRVHKVYGSIDTRKPPSPDDDYPAVHLFLDGKKGGDSLKIIDHILGASCAIRDDDLATTGKANAIEHEGLENLETFRLKVEAALIGALPTDYYITQFEAEYNTLEFFPAFVVSTSYVIRKDLYQGDDPFA